MLESYRNSLDLVSLSGPTNFSEVLTQTLNMVGASDCSSANQTYTTLLIITDGIISDLDTTIDRIVAGSTMPLSIVIVGVGNADFGPMEVLDADDCPLHDRNG